MQPRFSLALSAALVLLPLCALTAAQRECDQCSDLCSLVDQYWQKEKGIEIWKRYADSTPRRNRQALPATVTDVLSLETHAAAELEKALAGRKLPCKTVQEEAQERGLPPPPAPQGMVTGLTTEAALESCPIKFGNDVLDSSNEDAWRKTHVCKGSAEAELAHEKVHQQICKDTWARNKFAAPKRLGILRYAAESELRAWRRHQNLLRDEIQRIAMKCGWQPTDRQKNNPEAVPTPHQTKFMEDIGWDAFNILLDRSF